LPVSSQTRDMVFNPDFLDEPLKARRAPPVSRSGPLRQRRGRAIARRGLPSWPATT
jgi:hypothetical protein